MHIQSVGKGVRLLSLINYFIITTLNPIKVVCVLRRRRTPPTRKGANPSKKRQPQLERSRGGTSGCEAMMRLPQRLRTTTVAVHPQTRALRVR